MSNSFTPDPTAYRTNLLWSIPFLLAIPVVIGLVIVTMGAPFQPLAVVAGVIGWVVALVLRAPVALIAMRIFGGDRERAQPVITAASGPAEEIVRLVVVILVGRAIPEALWIGLGWAAIEVVYSLVNGAAVLALMGRTDREAEAARAMLPIVDVMRADAPLWGIIERTWASLLHIGFTLIVAANPVFVVLTIVAHSSTNLLLMRWGAAKGVARLQLAGALWTLVVLAAAAAAWTAPGT